MLSTANLTQTALESLSSEQRARFAAAQQQLTELHTAQHQLTAQIDASFLALSAETQRIQSQQLTLLNSMTAAQSALTDLSAQQTESFDAARQQLSILQRQSEAFERNVSDSMLVIDAGQRELKTSQGRMSARSRFSVRTERN